jgi:DNA polymerase
VETEYLLDQKLTHLPKTEEKIWVLNQECNFRGVKVDVETSKQILDLISLQTKKLNQELIEITDGEVKTAMQRDKILEWLEEQGMCMGSLRAETVKDTIQQFDSMKPGYKANCKRVLEIRQSLSKSSTKKYKALLTRAGADERVRDISMYHGAHTGRDTGTGLQVLNLPRGKIKNIDKAIEIIKTGDLGLIELIYGDPFSAFSSVIRGMITATPGSMLYDADYNAIECRILNWLAGQEDILKMFRKDIDLYVKMATRLGSDDRQFGKTVELAGGYQMGPGKLLATSIAWGLRGGKGITMEEAELGIKVYRDSHPKVVKMWGDMEKAAIMAVRNPSKKIKTKYKINWAMQKGFLTCELPSGRLMYYFKPEVRQEPTPWGEYRPKLYYWHIESMTKQWVCSATYGGKLVENIVQGVSRDIMFDAALRLEEKGYRYLFNAYDELVSEANQGDIREYEKILMQLPKWAEGLPIKASGWADFRYRKV